MDRGNQQAQTSRSDLYFRRFGFCEQQIAAPPPPNLGLVVVIPCFNEPDLVGTLESLHACERPTEPAEVIVVINAPNGSSPEVQHQNERTLAQAQAWAATHNDPHLEFHFPYCPELPPKQAGVGLARKIGMDEALRRFQGIGRPGGIIACFDADCRCAPNYLRSVERHFQQHPKTPGCGIYFEHPLSGPLPAEIYEAIAVYELHLRYYVHALRYAGCPHAHHTVGSSMAVRAEVYAKQDGMNRRQAGEDFYFLHKVIPLGEFTELTETAVYPSPRTSDRVPFGTGKAMRDCLAGQPIGTYPLEAFLELKAFFSQAPAFHDCPPEAMGGLVRQLPAPIRAFLQTQHFEAVLAQIRANTATEAAFHKRFFRWFDGFQAMKFINYCRDEVYGERAVATEAQRLIGLLFKDRIPCSTALSVWELLLIFREIDRKGPVSDRVVLHGV